MEQTEAFLEGVRRQLKAERSAADWSVVELGERSGVARSSIGLFEKGERVPTIKQLSQLCNALGVDIIDFLRRARERE